MPADSGSSAVERATYCGVIVIKSLLQFGLTRSAIIVLGLVVFCAAGLVAFSRLNIEAYPNPAPVILEITAQAAGLSAEEMEKYYTIPMEVGLYPTPGVVNIRSTSFYGLSFVRVTFKYGVDYYFALTQAAISLQQNVNLPGNQVAADPAIQPGRRNLSLSGRRAAAFRADQSADVAGLGRDPAAAHHSRRGADQQLGRHHQAIRRRCRSRQARSLQHHGSATASPRSATPISMSAAVRSRSASSRSISAASD